MIAAPCSPQFAARHLLPVLAKANQSRTLTMGLLLDGQSYAVRDAAGAVLGVYVLKGQGDQVWIQAAAGRAGLDLCDLFDDLIQRHGAGFASIGFQTTRRGLVRKARARGYQITGGLFTGVYTMTKAIQ
jgi:hypothetical protein